MNMILRTFVTGMSSLCLAMMTSFASSPAKAITTPEIVESVLSEDCLDYGVLGLCVWLDCDVGCRINTSIKIRHFIPELVVSSYENTGQNPWTDLNTVVSAVTSVADNALGGGQNADHGADPRFHQNLRFKNVDAIGHPGTELFNEFLDELDLGLVCEGGAEPFKPYFISTLDALAWRSGIPEMVYPEALIPGMRELGIPGDMWGNVYPRSGFANQTHDYKAAALMAQRSADIVTRRNQPHVYFPLVRDARDGYWPPGGVEEGSGNHKWQHLSPNMSRSCVAWPDRSPANTYSDRLDDGGDYVFALWQRYKCCQKRGDELLADPSW